MLIAFPNVPKPQQIFLLVHKYFLTCRKQVCFYSPSSWSRILLGVLFCSCRTPRETLFLLWPWVNDLLWLQNVLCSSESKSSSVRESREYKTLCSLLLGAGQDSGAGHCPLSSLIQQPDPRGSAVLPCFQPISSLHSNSQEFAVWILFHGLSTSFTKVLESSLLSIHLYLCTRNSTVKADLEQILQIIHSRENGDFLPAHVWQFKG